MKKIAEIKKEIQRLHDLRSYHPEIVWQKINSMLWILGEPVQIVDNVDDEKITLEYEEKIELTDLLPAPAPVNKTEIIDQFLADWKEKARTHYRDLHAVYMDHVSKHKAWMKRTGCCSHSRGFKFELEVGSLTQEDVDEYNDLAEKK